MQPNATPSLTPCRIRTPGNIFTKVVFHDLSDFHLKHYPSPTSLIKSHLPFPRLCLVMQTFKTTTIDTERLRIRPITLEDAEAIYEIRSHHDVYKWT